MKPKKAKTLGAHIRPAGARRDPVGRPPGPWGSLKSRKTSRKRCFSAFRALRPSREPSRPAKKLQKTCPGPALSPVSQSRSVSWGPPAQENPPQCEENTTFRLFSSFSGRQNPARPAQGLPRSSGTCPGAHQSPAWPAQGRPRSAEEPKKAAQAAQEGRHNCHNCSNASVSSAKQSNNR